MKDQHEDKAKETKIGLGSKTLRPGWIPDISEIPSFEDIQQALGPDKMSFMSEMLRQDPPEDEEE